MTPTEKYETASASLRAHELEHIKVQRAYEESYEKLKALNRAAGEAWCEMTGIPQRGYTPPPLTDRPNPG